MFGSKEIKTCGPEVQRNLTPHAATIVTDELLNLVRIHPFESLFRRTEDGFEFVENIEEADGHFAFFPGLQVFSTNGSPRLGEVSDRGATGPNRPSRIAVGWWAIFMPQSILGRQVATVTYGMVGERTKMTEGGPAFEATAPMNARRMDYLVRDIAQDLIYQALGNAEAGEDIEPNIEGIQDVINVLKYYGRTHEDNGAQKNPDFVLPGWDKFTLGLTGENKKTVADQTPSRITVKNGDKTLKGSKSKGNVGQGVDVDKALGDAEALLKAAGI